MMVSCKLLLYYGTFSSIISIVLSCVATSPTGTVTTTVAPTTTTAATGCTSCTASQVTFAQSGGGVQIDTAGIPGTAAGCLTLTLTCTAGTGNYAFMQFNNNQGGPAENQDMGMTINALANCVDGNWVYTSGGVSRIVTQVSCNQAPNAG
ncbi:uncharacterized protein CELE_C30G12.4 [Caenorhabditis elegans]|nr:Uncharacterized protein CELE_C30G12.4 [Caenorhabditis elegans]CCD66259.2 Uncharacterized protein CELE_C30G12.4 [Caenorhabditis elegans]|eukprot:NP_495517.3 Uncharacterized protein CELE_C30G12.4 [Caenorhabditis elegans]